jgi:hypothetical protein
VPMINSVWMKKRETRTVQRRLLEDFYRSFVNLHHDYKKIRRTLRATTIQDPKGLLIQRGTFEQLIPTGRLSIEGRKHEKGSCRAKGVILW